MAVYAVITAKPEPFVDTALMSRYGGKFYRYSDQTWVVSTPESATQLATALGSKRKLPDGTLEGPVNGYMFVTELGPNYWGFSNQAFWNWLKEAHEGRV